MPLFSLSKVDKYRNQRSKSDEDIIDIKFPVELKPIELLVFVVEDDPVFLQILNTHLSKLTLEVGEVKYRFKVKNYATGNSCIKALENNPDLIFLNFYINKGICNALTGRETLNKILQINPNQKVVILNDLEEKMRGAFVENGLRDYIIQDERGLIALNNSIKEILS
ncbi:MAG: response regulator [Fulvivirga sp.]